MILQNRNTVNFDPSIKEHRSAVACFLKRNAWADSPIRFSYDPEYGSVAEQVKSKLLDWHVKQETSRGRTVNK